jgi:hypothetical protein
MSWKKLLESASESLNDHLRLRNNYLMAENRILRNQIDGRVHLTDNERKALAALGAQLGKKALSETPPLPNRTPSWPGIASSPINRWTPLNHPSPLVVLARTGKSKTGCSAWFCQLVVSPASQWHNERVIDTRMSHPTA